MMPPRLRDGVQALLDYNPLIFSHVLIEPGETAVLVADPWAYARAHLAQEVEGRQSSPKKTRLNRAIYYVRQAEGFYRAANGAQLRTKGVLSYYGMLNLVKAFLSVRGVELETVREHHGLTIPLDKEETVEIAASASKDNVNIFHEFARLLDTPVDGNKNLDFLEVCENVPELHSVIQKLSLADSKPRFLPVDISFLVNEDFDRFFTELSYAKRHQVKLNSHKFLRGERKKYSKAGVERDGRVVHQSARLFPFSKDKCAVKYKNRLKKYRQFSIVSILTRSGYKYYCNLEDPRYHHLCYSFVAMFFIGSISRYRPTAVEEHFVGMKRPVASEALALCPDQFLYQLVSLITGSLCVVPYSRISES